MPLYDGIEVVEKPSASYTVTPKPSAPTVTVVGKPYTFNILTEGEVEILTEDSSNLVTENE